MTIEEIFVYCMLILIIILLIWIIYLYKHIIFLNDYIKKNRDDENGYLDIIDKMCIESLPPDIFDKWRHVKRTLKASRIRLCVDGDDNE